MVLKPALEAIDIWFRKVQPPLYTIPMPAFLLRHDCLLCCLEATACGVSRPADRGMPRQIRLSTEDRCHFGFSTHLAHCSFGRFPARFAIAAGTDAAGPSCSLGCRVMRLCIAERSGDGDTSSSPWRRSGAIISFMLYSPANLVAFLMSDHAPGCGRFAPRPDPRNGLQQLLSPLLRSFLAH